MGGWGRSLDSAIGLDLVGGGGALHTHTPYGSQKGYTIYIGEGKRWGGKNKSAMASVSSISFFIPSVRYGSHMMGGK